MAQSLKVNACKDDLDNSNSGPRGIGLYVQKLNNFNLEKQNVSY